MESIRDQHNLVLGYAKWQVAGVPLLKVYPGDYPPGRDFLHADRTCTYTVSQKQNIVYLPNDNG